MQLTLDTKPLWLFQKPVDFRRGKNGLLALIVSEQKNPNEGLYLFRNKRGDKLKCLCWHKNGFLLLWKELERGKFSLSTKKGASGVKLSEEEFKWLLGGLPWEKMSQWGEQSFGKFS